MAFTPVFTPCTTFGATASAHLTIAFAPAFVHCPIAFPIGFAYLPHTDTHFNASAGTAISPNHLACSCTHSLPHRNFAVLADMSPAFCHTYPIHC